MGRHVPYGHASVCVLTNQPFPPSNPPPTHIKQNDAEAALYRAFLGVPTTRRTAAALAPAVAADEASVLSAVRIGAGSVKGAVLTNVVAAEVEAEGAVLVNVTARKIKAAKGAVVYNVVDDSEVGGCVGVLGWVGVGAVGGGLTGPSNTNTPNETKHNPPQTHKPTQINPPKHAKTRKNKTGGPDPRPGGGPRRGVRRAGEAAAGGLGLRQGRGRVVEAGDRPRAADVRAGVPRQPVRYFALGGLCLCVVVGCLCGPALWCGGVTVWWMVLWWLCDGWAARVGLAWTGLSIPTHIRCTRSPIPTKPKLIEHE